MKQILALLLSLLLPLSAFAADAVKPVGGFPYFLAGSGISASATSITLSSLTIPQTGTELTDSDFSETFYLTIEPGSRTRQEFVSCTTVTQSTGSTAILSGCTRGLSPISPYTSSSSFQFAHAGGSTVIFSDPPQLLNQFAAKDNDETITGDWRFPTPTAGTNAATKSYVDGVVNGGTLSYDQIISAGTAGETFATGTILYFKRSDARWYKADTDVEESVENAILGIAQGAGSSGAAITDGVLLFGLDTTQVGMSAGVNIFLSSTAGATTTSTTTVGLGKAKSATELYFNPFAFAPGLQSDNAFTGANTFSGSNTFSGANSVTGSFTASGSASSNFGSTTVRYYKLGDSLGGSSTQFDVTNPAGTTFRYTYDGTGTDPGITSTTVPTGATVMVNIGSFAGTEEANNGSFTVTGSGTNYFEVTNASGVAATNDTLGAAGFLRVATNAAWSKPTGLRYAEVEVIAGGGGGGGNTSANESSAGGGSGAYAREIILAAALGSTETITVGGGGRPGLSTGGTGATGGTSSFGSHLSATGGAGGTANGEGGAGGTASGGDLNLSGKRGGSGNATAGVPSGAGGDSIYGFGGPSTLSSSGYNGTDFGGGGGGVLNTAGADLRGGFGGGGGVIVREVYY